MDLFRVIFEFGSHSFGMTLTSGLIGTAETGSSVDGVDKARRRVTAIVSCSPNGPAGWIQLAEASGSGELVLSHEGWVQLDKPSTIGAMNGSAATLLARLEKIEHPTEEMLRCQATAQFGAMSCCTSYGSGCYVTCCNSCCSDPMGCPGAGCCG